MSSLAVRPLVSQVESIWEGALSRLLAPLLEALREAELTDAGPLRTHPRSTPRESGLQAGALVTVRRSMVAVRVAQLSVSSRAKYPCLLGSQGMMYRRQAAWQWIPIATRHPKFTWQHTSHHPVAHDDNIVCGSVAVTSYRRQLALVCCGSSEDSTLLTERAKQSTRFGGFAIFSNIENSASVGNSLSSVEHCFVNWKQFELHWKSLFQILSATRDKNCWVERSQGLRRALQMFVFHQKFVSAARRHRRRTANRHGFRYFHHMICLLRRRNSATRSLHHTCIPLEIAPSISASLPETGAPRSRGQSWNGRPDPGATIFS